MEANVVLGVDIGGTKIRMGLVDPAYGLSETHTVSTERLREHGDVVQAICHAIKAYWDALPARYRVLLVAVGIPSTLSKDRELVLSTPNIAGLDNVALKGALESALHCAVVLERDVNFLIYNDVVEQRLNPKGTAIGCYVGTGFGNAVLINGRLLIGKHGVACELGHIPIANNGRTCVCGNVGCAETIASGKHLCQLQEEYLPGVDINNVFAYYEQCAALREFVENLALPIATEINLFDPDAVILGGGVILMPGFPRRALEESILSHTRKPLPAQDLRLIYSIGDDYNGVRGAGIFGQLEYGINKEE